MTSGDQSTSNDLMTVEDIARALHRERRSAMDLLYTKKIKSFKEGKRRFVRRADFEAYIKECEEKSASERPAPTKGGES